MELKVRAVRLARGVNVLLDVLDGADPSQVLSEQAGEVSSAEVREAIRLARLWARSGVVPLPETVREVIVLLRGVIGALLPPAEFYRAGLPLSSRERSAVREWCADAEDLAGSDTPDGPAEAVAHAAALGESAGLLLRLAEANSGSPGPLGLTTPEALGHPVTEHEGVAGGLS
ncbi:DUF6415 family natural product biosynthesis protein [Streptomyces sp. NPDC058653]|uniref:DUF6415 family natural product biosynthesis protein n=1 Tax=Streptomyces sp. NPDC058653 TaxID=3346576 RepID=UPI003664FD79